MNAPRYKKSGSPKTAVNNYGELKYGELMKKER